MIPLAGIFMPISLSGRTWRPMFLSFVVSTSQLPLSALMAKIRFSDINVCATAISLSSLSPPRIIICL